MKESPIEKHLRKLVEAAGGRCKKWVSPGNNGVPDRIVFLPGGLVFFVETKSTVGKLRPTQVVQHKDLQATGTYPIVLSSKEQVADWIETQLKVFAGYSAFTTIKWISELDCQEKLRISDSIHPAADVDLSKDQRKK